MNKSNGNPSFLAATLHDFAPLWCWERIVSFFLTFFNSSQLFYERSIKQALMSYWHFNLSAYAPCFLCRRVNSRGSDLGVCFHITLCQFLNCSSVSLLRDFFELLTPSLPGCSAQCQPATFFAPPPPTLDIPSVPLCLVTKLLGVYISSCYLPPHTSLGGALLQATGHSWVLMRVSDLRNTFFPNKTISLW